MLILNESISKGFIFKNFEGKGISEILFQENMAILNLVFRIGASKKL
jgi:hypothetical protein